MRRARAWTSDWKEADVKAHCSAGGRTARRARRSAAVEHDELPGQVGRRVAGEVEGGPHDLVGRGDPTEGYVRGHLGLHLLRRQECVETVGVERAANDRVDPDPARS